MTPPRPTGPRADAVHQLDATEACRHLAADPVAGLTSAEARRRCARDGPNELQERRAPTLAARLVAELANPLIALLIVAAGVAGVALGEWVDSAVIMTIVVVNAVIGLVQQARAEAALQALRNLSAPTAVVRRDGEDRRIPATGVVRGDLLILDAGDRVAADGRLVESHHLEIDESAMTGESLPATKNTEPVAPETVVPDRHDMVHAATVVTAGRGIAVVSSTGMATEVGRIAGLLGTEEPTTPLAAELDRVGRRLTGIVVVIAAIVFVVGVTRGLGAEAVFLTSVALAVAAIPEGLPAVVTITLARGVRDMAAHRAIVRRLTAVEALGAATVICTDKTGTLTLNELAVRRVHAGDRDLDPDDVPKPLARRLWRAAALCSDARRADGHWIGDPTEIALARAASDHLDVEATRREHPRLDEAAFDSVSKRMTTLHRRPAGGSLVAMKGAPEVVLDRCAAVGDEQSDPALDPARRSGLMAVAARYAADGLRTLALAERVEADRTGEGGGLVEDGLTLLAVVGLSDEVRPEAREAVAGARAAGIRVVIVTGDHEVTARSIADQVGVDGDVLHGRDLAATDPDDLDVDRYGVYARVDPADKLTLVQAFQHRGDIVAMTGDGVNDAPALHAADIGVAMGSGTDVARDAADLVLTDDDFATVVRAVRAGRTIYANLQKVVHSLLSTNLTEVLVMLVGFLAFAGEGQPLLATQLLWVNLVTDGLPAIALGMDRAAPGLMRRTPDQRHGMLSGRRQLVLAWHASLMTVGVLASFVVGWQVLDHPWPRVQTMGLGTLVLVQLLYTFNVRAQGTTALAMGLTSNPLLLGGVAASMALHVAVVHTGIGHELFDTVSLSAVDWAVVVAGALGPVAIIDQMKRARVRERARGSGPPG